MTTHWSISWIRPKRSAVSMNAAGMTISPSSPIMRSSSSYWVIESLRELHDRLAVEDEAVLVERAADLVGPVEADLHAGDVLAAVGGGDVVAVAAGLLGRVHREVGADHAGPRRAGSSSPKQTMPIEVVIEMRWPSSGRRRSRIVSSMPSAMRSAVVAVGVAQQHGELVAAEAGDDVGLADAARAARGRPRG